MPSKQLLLTIGIPTWNRSEELQECIQLIAAQVEPVCDEVEIFVSDNASDDGTKELLHAFASKYRFLRYSRNESNIGPDCNFLEVFKRATGKYVWLFSDDDFMADGAVAEILRIVRTYDPSYITTNYLWCNKQRTISNLQPQRKSMVAKDSLHVDINQMFAVRSHWLSFMSCNIYRCDLLDLAEYKANKDMVTNWIQVYITAHVLSNKADGYLASYYAVLARSGNCPLKAHTFVVAMPEAFSYIFNKFSVAQPVSKQVMEGIRTTFVPLSVFVAQRALDLRASPLSVPLYYKLALLVPKRLILIAIRTKRFLGGRGYTLPEY